MHTTVGHLSLREISQRLRDSTGLTFNIGPFVVRVFSRLASIADHIAEMYGAYEISNSAFVDFEISVESPRLLRSVFRRQVNFRFDDEYPFKPLPFEQARPFFEWGLNWCIATTAHQYLIIHAAVVARGRSCALIPGRPGAGKSTLCAALVTDGWRLLSDEMALVRLSDGKIQPIPRPISLKNRSIDIIGAHSSPLHIGPAFTDTHKGTVAHMRAPIESVHSSNIPADAKWVVYPCYDAGANLFINAISGCNSALKLADESFNFPLLGSRGFEALSNLALESQSFELRYSQLEDAIAWFNDLDAGADQL
jgi:HprK-related kinase A